MIKEYFTPQELEGIQGLPTTARNIRIKAVKEQWFKRKKQQGKGFEYHINSLPEDVKKSIFFQQAKAQIAAGKIEDKKAGVTHRKDKKAFTYDRENLWENYDRKSSKQKEIAKAKFALFLTADDLHATDIPMDACLKQACENSQWKWPTIRDIYYGKKGGKTGLKFYDKTDWLAALVPHHIGSAPNAECHPEAWNTFKADYLRLEEPGAAACYERLKRTANANSWAIPCKATFERRIKREIPLPTIILMRQGETAMLAAYPAQERTVVDLHACEWINGDGYQHNVFVMFPNGEIGRPKTWFWQDIHSRKWLTWRTDRTENTETIRLSYGQLVETYGIPAHATIDNTRAAANKWMTGGTPNRYRFKIKDDDPLGIMTILGTKVHWTTVHSEKGRKGKGHGQAKPVERGFGVGGLGEYIDKHPAFAGAYTGANTSSKPDNYGETVIPYKKFIEVLDQEMLEINARIGRRTEMCYGELSYDQAFEKSYSQAIIKMPTKAQSRLWLLAAEAIPVKKDGTFVLQAGAKYGSGKNRYAAEELMSFENQKVVVRFNPQRLHDDVYVYHLNGNFIAKAECLQAVGYGDVDQGREWGRLNKQRLKLNKESKKVHQQIDVLDVAAQLPTINPPEIPTPAVTEGCFEQPKLVVKASHTNSYKDEVVPKILDKNEQNFIGLIPSMKAVIQKRQDDKI